MDNCHAACYFMRAIPSTNKVGLWGDPPPPRPSPSLYCFPSPSLYCCPSPYLFVYFLTCNINIVKQYISTTATGPPVRTLQGLLCYPDSGSMIRTKQERFMRALEKYAQFHRNTAMDKNARKLVWVCLHDCGGLGDRIKGMTYTLLLAMFSQRRLLITWESYDYTFLTPVLNFTSHYHGPVLQLSSIFGEYGIDKNPEAASKIFKSIGDEQQDIFLSTNLEPYKLLSSKKRNLGIQWIVNGLTNTGLGNFRPEDMDGLLGPVFNYLFRLDSNLLDKVNQARSILGLEGNPYVGVHVRTGFAGAKFQEPDANPKLVRDQHSWEKILECGVRTADRLLGNDSLIFLACDSIMVKDIAHRRYGQRIRTIHNKLMHVDRLPAGRKPEDERAAILTMWIDLILLAESYALVRTDSGFATLAGQMCPIPDHRIIHGLHCR